MTPEKNIKVENNVNKINPKVGKKAIRLGLSALVLLGGPAACVATQGVLTTPTPEVSPLPSDLTKTPALSPTEAPVKLTPIVENTATQELTLIPSTEVATTVLTPEGNLSVDSIPGELNFIDGRNVKEMASNVGIDVNTGLEVAINQEGSVVAYNLKTENNDLWVVNPLLEKGFKWNFDTNENGQYILHNALEEWDYKAFPIEGIKYVKPDQLPATFWDESDPVREDEKYPWPREGSLAVFDGEGDVLMYYSKHENAWWYAGYQVELPGNMTFRQSGSSLALTGIRYKSIDESVWKGPEDLKDRWQEIRNRIDWLAYTRRTGNYISLENFSSRVSSGEIFEYQSWLFDLATSDYKLVTLNNKTKLNFQYSLTKSGFVNGYEDLFHAKFHGIPNYSGGGNGLLLNPDNSISIINFDIQEQEYNLKYPWFFYLYSPLAPFLPYTVNFLAASDSVQKEGIKIKVNDSSFYNLLSVNEMVEWYSKLQNFDPILTNPDIFVEPELRLSLSNPLIYPNIDSVHH